jgi:hypothetical protein
MGVVRVAEKQTISDCRYPSTNIIPILIPSYYLSYQGGGDYRGTYDIGFKRGFMGYIGLLLNDPYKRDRIDG